MSQTTTFSQRVNQLFFGVDVSTKSASLLDSFLSIPQLHHHSNGARQWSLNIAMEMESDKAWSVKHVFDFTESPLPDLKIEKGTIGLVLGETGTAKKLLDLYWLVQFTDKTTATIYFDKLKQLFSEPTTNKKLEHDKGTGEIAQFSTRHPTDTGVRDISLCLGKSETIKKRFH